MHDWTSGVDAALDRLADLLDAGFAERLLDLALYGHRLRLVTIMERLADALDLERRQFRCTPSTGRYRRLRAVAEPLGRWPDERAVAHRVAREHLAAADRAATGASTAPACEGASPRRRGDLTDAQPRRQPGAPQASSTASTSARTWRRASSRATPAISSRS